MLPNEEIIPHEQKATVNDVWSIWKLKRLPLIVHPQKYIYTYEKYIEKEFGDVAVEDITPLDIETFIIKLSKATTQTGKYLQPGTVKDVLKFLKSLIHKASVWGMIGEKRNPVGIIDIKDSDKRRERYLTHKEADILLDACQHVDCTLYYVSVLSLYSGMRLGEILTLRCEQINLQEGFILIDGKTGRRTVFIHDKIKPILKKVMDERRRRVQNHGYIFTTKDKTKPYSKIFFSRKFAQLVNDLGFNDGISDHLNKVVFHTLRHTFCSWLAIQGVPIYTIAELAGHKDVSMTQRYAKLSPESKRNALQGLDAMPNAFRMSSFEVVSTSSYKWPCKERETPF